MKLYYALLLLATSILSASETCIMQQQVGNIPTQGEFVLCINSRNSGVDCAVFGIENNVPVLLLSTYIKNEDIKNFAESIKSIVTCIKSNYGITIKYACFSAPGVPSAQKDYLTHPRLPYVIDTKEIIPACGLTEAFIVNNFLALSHGIDFLDKDAISSLHDVPAEEHGIRAIVGAGSGLGTVTMIWNEEQQRYNSLPSEAGTGNFPVFDQFEFDLMMAMKKVRKFDTCHWAFFVALPAIEYMHQILQDMNYEQCGMDEKKKLDALTILTSAQSDACCHKVADLFYKFYARFMYNFVWTTLPFGGIYLVGETATDYSEMLSNIFLPEYFNCVATKKHIVQRIPIYVIKDDTKARMYGIAQHFLEEKKELFKPSFLQGTQEKFVSLWSYVKETVLAYC
jgi:glucokinase